MLASLALFGEMPPVHVYAAGNQLSDVQKTALVETGIHLLLAVATGDRMVVSSPMPQQGTMWSAPTLFTLSVCVWLRVRLPSKGDLTLSRGYGRQESVFRSTSARNSSSSSEVRVGEKWATLAVTSAVPR